MASDLLVPEARRRRGGRLPAPGWPTSGRWRWWRTSRSCRRWRRRCSGLPRYPAAAQGRGAAPPPARWRRRGRAELRWRVDGDTGRATASAELPSRALRGLQERGTWPSMLLSSVDESRAMASRTRPRQKRRDGDQARRSARVRQGAKAQPRLSGGAGRRQRGRDVQAAGGEDRRRSRPQGGGAAERRRRVARALRVRPRRRQDRRRGSRARRTGRSATASGSIGASWPTATRSWSGRRRS